MRSTIPVFLIALVLSACGKTGDPDGLPPRDLVLAALSAIEQDDARTAEGLAERLATRGDREATGWRALLLGLAHDLRSRSAEAEVYGPFPARDALPRALAQAEASARAFLEAAMSREDWPEARRNFERAQRRSLALAKKLEEQRGEAPPPAPTDPATGPEPTDPASEERPFVQPSDPPPAAPSPAGFSTERTDSDLRRRLFERIAEREREKRALRIDVRAAAASRTERDW